MDNTTSLRDHQGALYTLLVEFDRVCRKLQIPYVLFAGTLLGAVRHQGFIPWDDDLDVMLLRQDYERFLREAESALDTERFFLQKEFSEHWPMFFSKLRLNGTACLEKYHPKDKAHHQGVYIDIFPCDNGAKSVWGRKLQFCASRVVIAKALDARGYDTDSFQKKLFIGLCRLLPPGPFLRLVRKRRETGVVHSFLGGSSSFSRSVYSKSLFQQRIEVPFEGGRFPVPSDYDRLLTILYGDYMRLPPPQQRLRKRHAILVDLDKSYEAYSDYRDGMVFEVHTRSIR